MVSAELIRKMDLWFSRLVRYRAASKGGFSQCFTCSTIDSVVQMDCGHYIDREWLNTRFDPDNCRVQCRKCNRHLDGNIKRFSVLLGNYIGKEEVIQLQERSKEPWDMTEREAKELITKWRAECRQLRKDKNF